ncbi:MAG: hypothetical protein LBV23_11250 [Deltaproteobacteria bacterium]|jgi:hypothetical protein|nr:hypothetical protein [Deltaproteobacteria bacterium]
MRYFLILGLIVLLGACQPQGQNAGNAAINHGTKNPSPCPAKALKGDKPDPSQAWLGQSIGQLMAIWGKPRQIYPAQERAGFYDYVFQYTTNIGSDAQGRFFDYPYYGYYGYGPFYGFGPHGYWRHWPFSDFDTVRKVSCVAIVRVDQNRNVSCLNFNDERLCAKISPFSPPKPGPQ